MRDPGPLLGRDCGHMVCPGCGAKGEAFTIVATGKIERKLHEWQGGNGGPKSKPNGPRHTLERHGHDEAEARAPCCGHTFWTLAPALIAAARALQEA